MKRILFLTLILFPVITSATVLNVPADFASIQEAIASAVDNDTVLVAPGTYVENLDFEGKSIVVTSSEGPEVTIIDGNNSGRCVTFVHSEDENTVLQGFTLTNGFHNEKGSAVYIFGPASPKILDNIITGNSAGVSGGGICCFGTVGGYVGYPVIENNFFSNNAMGHVHAVASNQFTLDNNSFEEFPDTMKAVIIEDCNLVQVTDNTISGALNTGLFVSTSEKAVITGNTLTGNDDNGIEVFDTDSVFVTSNTALDNGETGIRIWRSYTFAQVNQNVVSGNGRYGAFIWGADMAVLDQNTAENNEMSGLYSYANESIVVRDCIANNNLDVGISVRNSISAQVYNNYCSENVSDGFYIAEVSNSIIEHNISFQNSYRGLVLWQGISTAVSNHTSLGNDYSGLFIMSFDSVSVLNTLSSNNGYVGIEFHANTSERVVNCTLAYNNNGISCSPQAVINLQNSIIWGNSSVQIGYVEGNFPMVKYCDVGEEGFETEGNINVDPGFLNPIINEFQLGAGSPCIDAGDNGALTGDVLLDLAGLPRFIDDPDVEDTGNGTAPIADMGAYEYQSIYVPLIELSTTELHFEDTCPGSSDTVSFVIYNLGLVNLELEAISNAHPVIFSITWNSQEDAFILPGDSLTVPVVFTPAEEILYVDLLTILSNDETTSITLEGTGVAESGNPEPDVLAPKEMVLYPLYPNPFNCFSKVKYGLPEPSSITIKLFNSVGREVATVEQGFRQAGYHEISLNGELLSSGLYLLQLRSGNGIQTRKVVVIK